MKAIFNHVFAAAKAAAVSIMDVAPVKATAASTLAFTAGGHGTALAAFVTLILIDLLTKYLSLSAA